MKKITIKDDSIFGRYLNVKIDKVNDITFQIDSRNATTEICFPKESALQIANWIINNIQSVAIDS
jgi:hypothetical protein